MRAKISFALILACLLSVVSVHGSAQQYPPEKRPPEADKQQPPEEKPPEKPPGGKESG